MNRTISIKTLLTILLACGLIASTTFAVMYYQRATASELRAQALEANLSDVTGQLNKSQSQLRNALAQVKQTTGQLSQAQAESQQRLSVIFAQEDNVKVLKSCLTGVAADDVYFRKGTAALTSWADSRSDDDYNAALDNFRIANEALNSVDADCSKASSLLE